MIITTEQLTDLWREVRRERAVSLEKNVVVLHSISEVDSACAVRLVLRFLDQHNMKFSSFPVNDFQDLRTIMRSTLDDSTEERTVFMVNCGATCYVKQLLEEDGINAVNVRFVVIDSHRPVDARYNNFDDRDHLLLLDPDDPFGPESVPAYSALDEITEDDYQQLVEQAAESGDDSDGGGSDGGGDGEGGGGRAKRRKSHAEASPSAGASNAREQLRAVNERKALLDGYYTSGSCYGKPAALCALSLIEQSSAGLSMGDLWPAIVGLTDQHVHQRASKFHYDLWHAALREKLATVPAPPETYIDEDGAQRRLPQCGVAPALDFRLMLHRHWTLYDAMHFSPYVAPRMQTWREGGLNRMQMVFVNMGLSLEQARVNFNTMASHHKNLAEKLPQACRNTVLSAGDMAFPSFELRFGYSWTCSATDAVHALTGLMVRHSMIGGGGGGGGNGGGGGRAGGEPLAPEDVREAQAAASCDDFWAAVCALDTRDKDWSQKLKEGIDQAKLLQRAVVMDGGLMITRRQLEANPAHRMQELNLQAIRPANSERFRHPLALLRLATFVRDAADVARTGRKAKWPLAVVGPDDGSGYCCIMGIRHKQLPRQPQFNVFGIMFQQVLQEEAGALKWDAERDGFDTAVVHVHRESVPTFMTELKIRLGQQAAADAAAAAAEAGGGGGGDAGAGAGAAGGGDQEAGGGGEQRGGGRQRRRGGGSPPAGPKRRGGGGAGEAAEEGEEGEEMVELGDAEAEVDQ